MLQSYSDSLFEVASVSFGVKLLNPSNWGMVTWMLVKNTYLLWRITSLSQPYIFNTAVVIGSECYPAVSVKILNESKW